MIKFRDELICGDYFLQLSLIHTCFLLQQYGKCWPAARNKSDYEALANLAKISCRQVKVDLHIPISSKSQDYPHVFSLDGVV